MPENTDYSSRRILVDEIEVARLIDRVHDVEVSIAPSIGNIAYEMLVKGSNILWSPFSSPSRLQSEPTFCSIPFLAPWANRVDAMAYWANGRKYFLNPDLGNLRRDAHQKPIHGLLHFCPLWQVVASAADDRSAWVTSRLEFWKHPDLMAQFPFAHNLSMTYRLSNGTLEVETSIENLSAEPLPVAVGFHPYLRLDAPRDQWKVHIAARDHLVLDSFLVPTGERKPMPFTDPQPLDGVNLDDVFADLVRDADGKARFWVEGGKQRVTVDYGPKYRIAIAYSPAGRDFICFEPMAAVTNAFNLAHAGIYQDLESVPPGGSWQERFWITPTGF